MHGKLEASVLSLTGAYIYNWRVALASAPDVYVLTMQTTRADATFEGLVRGGIYNVQVCALGAAGPTEWSGAANIVAP